MNTILDFRVEILKISTLFLYFWKMSICIENIQEKLYN